MPISLDNLPYNADGGLDGVWTFELRQNINGVHSGTQFLDGVTVSPVGANAFRRFVATMGNDMVGALRHGEDEIAIGDVSKLRPDSYDEQHSKSLAAQSSNLLLNAASMVAATGKENEHTDVAHAVAGAKFISEDEVKARKEFDKASGHKVKGKSGTIATERTAGDGTVVRSGGEPVDPSTLPEGDPLKPVPTPDTAKVGEVKLTVDTAGKHETFTADVKSAEKVAPPASTAPHADKSKK